MKGIGLVKEIAGIKWRILDKMEDGYLAVAEDSIGRKKFDDGSNNWKTSGLREYLNTVFRKQIEDELGENTLVEFERNLLSVDGQDEYGTCEDKVSIISLDEYRKYRKLLLNTKFYWWTLTPDSNDDTTWIAVVSPSGHIDYDSCSYCIGVRPVCIFPFAIFES